MNHTPLQQLLNAASKEEKRRCALQIIDHDPPYPSSIVEFAKMQLGDAWEASHVDPQVLARDCNRIQSTNYFDSEWYATNYHREYPELLGMGKDQLVAHFCSTGWQVDLSPSPKFNTRFYLDQYPDIEAAKINPLYHYIVQGKNEGRMALPLPTTEQDPYQSQIDVQYIRESRVSQLHYRNDTYRVVAFYLPQYHPIPENDEWWGKDFTEWVNVKPAKPLFAGHYQPHEPAELGYYIIEDSLILKRQALLAQSYGVDAFCFYFYWFNGKTLLERPLDLLLNNPSIALDFCLCWANENWTRRWDGKEDDVLLAQTYSHEDDLEFIKYISKYLRDPRYLRINGRPVLLIYRPSLFPDPAATTRLWRDWCIENGIGDLHLVYTQSFECAHPTEYGCDAATEFSPNIPVGHLGATPRMITDSVANLAPDFQGKIFDWSGYVERSNHLPHPGYPIYRCVNPGWDNTARKKMNSTVFINSSPRSFQKWTLNALDDTSFAQGDNGLLFVNAWNEWAEGAHLEPDQRYGYGYLDALRMARTRHHYRQVCQTPATKELPNPSEIAIIVHAFYPEILDEIIGFWEVIPSLNGVLFIITTPPDKVDACRQVFELRQPNCKWIVFSTENHGRDILPFCKVYEFAVRAGVRIFCKLHTKKSKHRSDGNKWRQDLYSGLLNPERTESILNALYTNSGIGIVLPKEHILPITEFFGSNCDTVCSLAARLGLPVCTLNHLPLVAGSMFWARYEALIPLHMLFSEEYFETESGQLDGTFAHALERIFSISAASLDLQVADTDLQPYSSSSVPSGYEFAARG